MRKLIGSSPKLKPHRGYCIARIFAALTLGTTWVEQMVPSAVAQVVDIPDPALNATIRLALNRPLGDILRADMEKLTELDASRRTRGFDEPYILSLEGLQAARNLRTLDLGGDMSATTPQELRPSLWTNDLSPLADLAKLESLDLSHSGFTTLTLPDGLTNLTSLLLTYNFLSDLDFAKDLPGLESLDVSENAFTNLTLSEGFTSLLTLDISDNPLTSFYIASGLTQLRSLDLGWWRDWPRNPLRNVELHAGLTNLQHLDLTGAFMPLNSHLFIRYLGGLTTLYLSGNGLYAGEVLLVSDLTNLTHLDLSNNHLSWPPHGFLGWPAGPTNLVFLNIGFNELKAITFPSGLTKLQTLLLWGNQLPTLSLPADMTNLLHLDISGNALTNLFLPPDLEHIRHLFLNYNRLPNLNFLQGITSVEQLHLVNNGLTNVTLPSGLRSLGLLDVSDNPLTFLGVPESLNLEQLEILGFPKARVTILMLRIGPAIVLSDGRLQLQLSGASGQNVRVQRSANLIDWEDWRTVTLDGTGCELIDEAFPTQRFYRAVEDSSVAVR